jgi:branched-chain amino acid transport system ATP-binding protein
VTAVLRCEGLVAGYGTLPVARDISLTITAGEVAALLGPNGAGKTTLLRTLAGLLPALGGEAQAGVVNIVKANPRHVNKRGGLVFVPDDRALFRQLTARQNLWLAGNRRHADLEPVLSYMPQLRGQLDKPAGLLSGGEQQMLAIARALIQRPRVLLIDELSMGLAPRIVDGLLSILRRIADDAHTAVLFTEQHAEMALKYADRALIIVNGSLTRDQSAESLRGDREGLARAYFGS